MAEKRKTERIHPLVAPCRLEEGGRRLGGFVIELSVRGARISTDDAPPAAGTKAFLEVRLGRRIVHSRLPAEVKWVRTVQGRHECGLVFGKIGPEEQKLLEGTV